MRNFFTRQAEARSATTRLVILFAMAVIATVAAVYLVTVGIYNATQSFRLDFNGVYVWWQPRIFGWTVGGTLLLVIGGAWIKMQELRSGGRAVAELLGGKLLKGQTEDPGELRFLNVVEEMAIASGVPVPAIYVLERERGINAFAAGYGIDDAAICVTQGALALLTRDELQGVVAHEFSHILNGDMRLNLRLISWLNGLLVIGLCGRSLLSGLTRSRERAVFPAALFGLIILIIGYIGYFFGQLVKSAISRQREYLGDAAAVQFTRNPSGLAGALKKIGGLGLGSRLLAPNAAELSHLYFSDGIGGAWLQLLDSHPPLEERIRRLDPTFRGHYPKVEPLPSLPEPEQPTGHQYQPRSQTPPAQVLNGIRINALLDTVGAPLQDHLLLAQQLLGSLAEPLRQASREPFAAKALIYALLLEKDAAGRARQFELLATHAEADLLAAVRDLSPQVDRLDPRARLPLVDLALPALRTLERDQYERFRDGVRVLSEADGRLSLFEFALAQVLLRHLDKRVQSHPATIAQYYALRGVRHEASLLLSTLAHAGHREEEQAAAAFKAGAQVLQDGSCQLEFVVRSACTMTTLNQALTALEGLNLPLKRRLLAACLVSIQHDGMIGVAEIEFFRAVADALGCPVPPWLNNGAGQVDEVAGN